MCMSVALYTAVFLLLRSLLFRVNGKDFLTPSIIAQSRVSVILLTEALAGKHH